MLDVFKQRSDVAGSTVSKGREKMQSEKTDLLDHL